MEEVGGEEGNVVGGEGGDGIVDEVFESVEMALSGGGGEGSIGGGAEVPDNVGGGEGGEVMDTIGGGGGALVAEEQKGEKEKETIVIGNGGDNSTSNVGESNFGGANIGVESSFGGAEEGDGASVGGGEDGAGGGMVPVVVVGWMVVKILVGLI